MTFSEDEASKMLLLRSLEWEALPVFATRSFAPIALFWLTWWQLLLLLAVPSLLWCPIRTRFVSFRLAMVSSLLNNIFVTLLANVLIAIVFFAVGAVTNGVIALFWLPISAILAFVYPRLKTLDIRNKLSEQMAESSNLQTYGTMSTKKYFTAGLRTIAAAFRPSADWKRDVAMIEWRDEDLPRAAELGALPEGTFEYAQGIIELKIQGKVVAKTRRQWSDEFSKRRRFPYRSHDSKRTQGTNLHRALLELEAMNKAYPDLSLDELIAQVSAKGFWRL